MGVILAYWGEGVKWKNWGLKRLFFDCKAAKGAGCGYTILPDTHRLKTALFFALGENVHPSKYHFFILPNVNYVKKTCFSVQ
jgi:hypothetical protein